MNGLPDFASRRFVSISNYYVAPDLPKPDEFREPYELKLSPDGHHFIQIRESVERMTGGSYPYVYTFRLLYVRTFRDTNLAAPRLVRITSVWLLRSTLLRSKWPSSHTCGTSPSTQRSSTRLHSGLPRVFSDVHLGL